MPPGQDIFKMKKSKFDKRGLGYKGLQPIEEDNFLNTDMMETITNRHCLDDNHFNDLLTDM